MIKVSVCVAVYNASHYIERCIASLLNQTLEEVEYIFIDDCSTDNSLLILKDTTRAFPKKRKNITVLQNDKNEGPGVTRYRAGQIAKGEYLYFPDADDWIDLNTLEELYSAAKNKGADLAVCKRLAEGTDVKQRPQRVDFSNEEWRLRILSRKEVNISLVTRLIGKELYEKAITNYPLRHLTRFEDYLIVVKAHFYSHLTVGVDKYLYHNDTSNPCSLTKRFTQTDLDSMLIVANNLAEFIETEFAKEDYLQQIACFKQSAKAHFITNSNLWNPEKWRNTWPEISRISSKQRLHQNIMVFLVKKRKDTMAQCLMKIVSFFHSLKTKRRYQPIPIIQYLMLNTRKKIPTLILFITSSNCGGAERMTLLYAKILKQYGYECKLLILMPEDKSFRLKAFIPADLPYVIVSGSRVILPYLILDQIKKAKPAYIFDFFDYTMTTTVVRFLSKLLWPDIKIIFRECNMPLQGHTKRQLAIGKLFIKYADVIVSQTNEMKMEMQKCYSLSPEKITVINNPIDTDEILKKIKEPYHYNNSDCIHYVAVGRVAPQKDYITLLKAFAIVQHTLPKSQLHIVGHYSDDNYTAKLDDVITSLGLDGYVFFEGFQTNPYKYIKAANAFVLSSIYEGLPNVMQEAMFLRKPIVATRCIPYISQVIENDINGYVVDAGNSEQLADAMLKSLTLRVQGNFVDNERRKKQIVNLINK